jgi:hypothetical protein
MALVPRSVIQMNRPSGCSTRPKGWELGVGMVRATTDPVPKAPVGAKLTTLFSAGKETAE